MKFRKLVLSALAIAFAGLVVFGTPSSSIAASQTPWLPTTFTPDQNPDLVRAFGTLPPITAKSSLPNGMERAVVDTCRQATCGVIVPAWSIAAVVGPWDMGTSCTPDTAALKGCVLLLVNVGEQPGFFPTAQLGGGHYIVAPYPDGTPSVLSRTAVDLASYLTGLTMTGQSSPDRIGWMNQCSPRGCNTAQVDVFTFDNGGRFTLQDTALVTK